MRTSAREWGCLVLGAALLFAAGCERFQRKHVPVDHVAELGYPTCAGEALPIGDLITEQHLRSGPTHFDKTIVEHYSIRQRACMVGVTVRQEWPLGTADVEVLYDDKLLPVRIWKRITLPGLPDAGQHADIRRYELRTDPVSIKRRKTSGEIDYELLKGGRPAAVIGPGRGIISMWIRRAKLAVGQKVRELAIDVRGLEKISMVTLLREADMRHEVLGPVRVYTFYGRETVFADEHDNVIGDLAGMLPADLVKTPPPPPVPLYGSVDPVDTP